MHPRILRAVVFLWLALSAAKLARGEDAVAELRRELESLKKRVLALEEEKASLRKQIDVERLVVRRELIVSDTGRVWEDGFEAQQIPRGIYARSVGNGPGGLWVRSRLIKGEIDDPFDDRFHALERDGRLRRAPGHISWNEWIGGAWRQMAIIQGEGLEPTELPPADWSGGNHPGRLRFQTFRPGHGEPLTDALIGQGMMSVGGGGFGGGGLPYPSEVLQIWGGSITQAAARVAGAPTVLGQDGSGEHAYAIVAVGPQEHRREPGPATRAAGRARLSWDSVPGADAYIVQRDGRDVTGAIRIEGSRKEWTDPGWRRP